MSRPTYVGDCTECDRPMHATNRGSTRGLLRHAGHGLCQTCYVRYRRHNLSLPERVPTDHEDRIKALMASLAKYPPAPRGDWVENALCAQVDPDLFFAEGQGYNARPAQSICGRCEVRTQCAQWSIDHDEEHGVWGQLTPYDRRKLKQEEAS